MFHRKWLVYSSYFFINVVHVHVICENHFWRNIFTSYLATLLKIILLNLKYGYKKLNLNIYVFKRLRTLVLPTFNLFFYERYKLTMLSAMFFFLQGLFIFIFHVLLNTQVHVFFYIVFDSYDETWKKMFLLLKIETYLTCKYSKTYKKIMIVWIIRGVGG